MSRTQHHSGEAAQEEHKQRRKNKYKPRKGNKYRGPKHYTNKELRQEHISPQTLDKAPNRNHVESYDPTRPFALAPCQACGLAGSVEKTTCIDHESPIVIAISSKCKSPTACGIFCNINSIYNTSFVLHDDKLDARKADLHATIAALKQVHAFIFTKTRRDSVQTKDVTQIIIKTSSSWLTQGFAGSTDHYRYNDLSLEFDNLVDELGEYRGIRPIVKFWKVQGRNMAQQLAESTLRGWEEAKVPSEPQCIPHQFVSSMQTDSLPAHV